MLADLARQVYAELDAEWQRAAQEYERQTGDKLPCGPGCAECCKASSPDTPFVSLPMRRAEAALLKETLAALPASKQAFIRERVYSNHADTCLLLSPGGLCLVYEARPLWCRIFGLPGIMNCNRIQTQQGAWVEQWKQIVYEARQALTGDDSFVSLQALIRRWTYHDRSYRGGIHDVYRGT